MKINRLLKIISAISLAGIIFTGCGDEKVTYKELEFNKVFKTGQTRSHKTGDDGYYASTLGVERSFTRDNTKKIVTDNITKLQWQDNEATSTIKVDWNTATKTCKNLNLGGYTDWRLPTIEELESIINYEKSSNAEHAKYDEFIYFPILFEYDYYLSSTKDASSSFFSSKVWGIGFHLGHVSSLSTSASVFFARCVRAGQ